MSKALAPRHQALSVYDKEMLAVVFAVQHWRPYLLGHHFTILTDHRTIEYFLGQRITTPAQQKCLLKLLGYDYSIHYKAGKNNVAPDALSRKEDLFALTGLSQPVHQFVDEIQQSCQADEVTRDIILKIGQGDSVPHYTVTGSQLFYKDRIFVPPCDNWRTKILS